MSELTDQITGEVYDDSDLDRVLESYERVNDRIRKLGEFKIRLREVVGACMNAAGSTAKTQRVRGTQFEAVVKMPDLSFEQPILKDVWQAYPQFRDEFLKIGGGDVRLREYKKLETTRSSLRSGDG